MTKDANTGVELIDAPSVFRGLRFLPRWLSERLERRWLYRLELLTGSRIEAVWLFENSRFYNMGFAGNRLKLYHQVDLNQNLNPAKAARSSDVCFCTSDYIKQSLSPFTDNVYKIHHGAVELGKTGELSSEQQSKFNTNSTQAAYIGNLDIPLLDIDLLVATVSQHPEVVFHFVGGYSTDGLLYCRLRYAENVQWWGKVNSTVIPSILSCVDVLLVTYKEAFSAQVSSPHKMMEYFASGKVIVATYTDEYKDKRHLLAMVDDSKEYCYKFNHVISNLNEYNSPTMVKQRLKFAQGHTYSKQVDRIKQLLHKHNLHSLT